VPVRFSADEEEDGKERLLSDLTKSRDSEDNEEVGRLPASLNTDEEEEDGKERQLSDPDKGSG
jgi:hypothetical protein